MRDAYGLKPKDRPAMFVKCKVPDFERNVAQVRARDFFLLFSGSDFRQVLDTAKLLASAGSFVILPVGRHVTRARIAPKAATFPALFHLSHFSTFQ
jgi:hypothetical protein